MKSLKLAVLAISLVGILGVGNAMAATTDVLVEAEVLEICTAETTKDIIFPAIDPVTQSGPVDSTLNPGVILVKCTANTDITFATSGTFDLTGVNLGETMAFTPSAPTSTETPGTAGTSYNVNASIAQIAYQSVSADTYKGKFTVTVTP